MSAQRSGIRFLLLLALLALALERSFGAAAQAPTPNVLAGTIDVHTHSEPDSTKRVIDVIDLAKMAKERGMRGLVLKDHYETTANIAYLVRKLVPGIEVFGGITMDLTNGGVNPAAVENMAKVTGGFGRVVWMPTFDSESTNNPPPAGRAPKPYVSVSRNGQLLPEVKEVISIIAKNNLALATGHSSAEENLMLVHEGERQGLRSRMIVTHAVNSRMTTAQMQEAAKAGAFLEFTYLGLLGRNPRNKVEDFAAMIRAIGPAGVIMSTDLGQPENGFQPDGLAAYIQAMQKQGFTTRDLDLMTKENPARLLGLPLH